MCKLDRDSFGNVKVCMILNISLKELGWSNMKRLRMPREWSKT